MNLAKLKPGETGKITAMGAIGPLKRRLMDMGVLVGETISRGDSPFDCLEQSKRTPLFFITN